MLTIETGKLKLIALDLEAMSLLRKDRILLEKHLEIEFSDHQLSKETKSEVNAELFNKLSKVRENPENYEWYTNWEIILKSQSQSIGSIWFSGYPDASGSTEVSFYIDERYRDIGYATEALNAMVNWAFTTQILIQIEAETFSDNEPCKRLLAKCGFSLIKKDEDIYYWQLSRRK